MTNPKLAWFIPRLLSGNTTVMTTEDLPIWTKLPYGLSIVGMAEFPKNLQDMIMTKEEVVLGEILQKIDNPVEFLKGCKGKRLLICVPNEWSWMPQAQPFKNVQHKRHYDAESLARDLEDAGLTYTMDVIDNNGWSWILAEAY